MNYRFLRHGGALLITLAASATAARSHDCPFSHLTLECDGRQVKGSLVVLNDDVARAISPEPVFVYDGRPDLLARALEPGLEIAFDGFPLALSWNDAATLPSALVDRRTTVRFRAPLPASPPPAHGTLRVRCALFPFEPAHITFLKWAEADREPTLEHRFTRAAREWARPLDLVPAPSDDAAPAQGALPAPPPRLALLGAFTRSGFEHVLGGADHVLFICGLLLGGGSLRQLLVLATGFTAGHSATLALAVLDVVRPPTAETELVIAASIAWVGLHNLRRRTAGAAGAAATAPAWLIAAFGLVHGFGFASVLLEVGLPAGSRALALAGFNLGVEFGQVAVLLLGALALAGARRAPRFDAGLRLAANSAIVAAGVTWIALRFPPLRA